MRSIIELYQQGVTLVSTLCEEGKRTQKSIVFNLLDKSKLYKIFNYNKISNDGFTDVYSYKGIGYFE